MRYQLDGRKAASSGHSNPYKLPFKEKEEGDMTPAAKVSEWLQVIGTFGVILSLIFVGLQMQQTHEIALSATYQARTDTAVELSMGPIGSPEYLSGAAKVNSGNVDSLTKEEHIALVLGVYRSDGCVGKQPSTI